MFQHLDAAAGHRVLSGQAVTISLSVAVHLAALAALVRLPSAPMAEWTAEEVVEFLALEEVAPTREPPPPPETTRAESGALETALALPEPVSPPPVEAPSEIPPVEARLSLVVPEPTPPAFAGNRFGEGADVRVDSIAVHEALSLPYDVTAGERFRLPRLRNREVIVSVLSRLYPRRLAHRGLASAATLRLSIDERGRVDPNSVRVIAYDREEFAYIVMDVARRFRFTPARYRDENVPIVIDVPVQWVAGP